MIERAQRLRAWALARRKYVATAELREEIRRAYAGNRTHLSRAFDALARRTRWPRWALSAEAQRHGWQRRRRPWRAEEDEVLIERLGILSARQVARLLGRTRAAIQARALELGRSSRLSEGYTLLDLQGLFGERYAVVRRWYERGLLGRAARDGNGARIPDGNVLRFIRAHAGQYDLRRVDQVWFKAMLFGELSGGSK